MIGAVGLLPVLIVPAVVGAMVDELGMAEGTAGSAVALNFLGSAVACIAVALRVYHLDLRRVAAVGFVLAALSDGMSSVTGHSPGLFLMFRFLAGLGIGTAYAAITAGIARLDDPDRGFGLLMMFQFALQAIGLYTLPHLLPLAGITGMFQLIAGLDLLGAALSRHLPARGVEPAEPQPIELRVLLAKASLLSLVGFALYEAANMAQFTFSERLGVSLALAPEQIGLVLGVSSALGIPGALAIVWLGPRFGHIAPLLCGITCSVAAVVALMFAAGIWSYGIALCVWNFAWAFTLPFILVIQAELDPKGSVVTAGSFAAAVGMVVGPTAAALMVGRAGYGGVLGLAVSLYALTALLLFGCHKARIERN
jgi:predicted MFS family arabinose efflux permease